MELIEQRNKILNYIRTKFSNRNDHTMSVEFLLTQHDYALVAAQLIIDYPSVQSTYNIGVNDNKVKITLGIV